MGKYISSRASETSSDGQVNPDADVGVRNIVGAVLMSVESSSSVFGTQGWAWTLMSPGSLNVCGARLGTQRQGRAE